MHEYALGERILDAVLAELQVQQTPRGTLTRVRVVAGKLHAIVPDFLIFAYQNLAADTAAAGSVLELVEQPITCRCRACAWTGEVESPIFLCGACGSGDLEMLTGKEFYLDQLEIETDGHP